jgi:hypothetical protein
MILELRRALERVARRFRRVRLWGSLAICWLAWALVGAGLALVPDRPGLVSISGGWLVAALAVAAAATGVLCAILALRSVRDRRWVARRIEAMHPDLAAGLLAAVEEDAAAPSGPLGFLQVSVIRKVLEHRKSHDWDETVPSRTIRGVQVAHAVALASLVLAFVALFGQARSEASHRSAKLAGAGAGEVQIDPGNTSIEKGTSLLVVARFNGAVPGEASLVVRDASQSEMRRGMTRSLEDPMFVGRVDSVESDLSYRVDYGGQRSETYRVTVFEYPELLRTDAKLAFPGYTGMEPTTVEDIRHVTAVEGTSLTLLCQLNKVVASAKLVDEDGREIDLTPPEDGTHVYRTTFTLDETRRFKVQLVDREGRRNKLTADIVVNVTKNRPPTITLSQPARDVRVSPVEELTLKAKIDDDFGVVRHGISFGVAGQEPREVVLDGPEPPGRRVQAGHLIDFESLKVVPDQLLTYFFWAEDYGPDGAIRKTSGDMFFAEVRPFEEIFRQGEQPPGGSAQNEMQGENAQESGRLAELQKQIINGTWTLIRREIGAKPTENFVGDAKTLKESQLAVIEQAGQLGQKLRDATSKASLAQATRSMTEAEKQLGEAEQGPSTAPLRPALAAEQAAYQALLKLRAREFEVMRSNSRNQRGGSSGGSPSQMQLDQLELSADENRYEEQSTARSQDKGSQREQEQRELRQVLNRLRELGQRQTDLNQRLKELQSALEAAKDQKAREEIERQLKRLREQQQEILRDTDELRERMEREENRDRLADARREIEQGREHVRQASQALEEGRLSQALTEGTRAGRQLDDLREQLRKDAANRFSEEMTEMRDQARRLDEKQKELSEQLDAKEGRPGGSLRGNPERQGVQEQLGQQRERLDRLLDRMRNTVQDAEETEPLLAKELFDTVKDAQRQQVPDALKMAEQLAQAGVNEEAAKMSRRAGQGIEQVRKGVERAAESVLGDETASLRRAKGELDELGDQVDREIARASGQEPNNREGADRPQEGQQGQQGGQQDQQGQQGQPGQGTPRGDNQRQGNRPGLRGGPPQRGQDRQQAGSPRGGGGNPAGGEDRRLGGLPDGPGGPITGEGFREWSDRMRDVEELLDDPEMRAEAARIRDRVRGAREDYKRHSKEPDWTKLKDLVSEPIRELRDRIAEEVRRRESPDALVPIDRDPVPPQFAEGVRRYYERLGSGR